MPPVKPMLAKAVPEIPAAAEGELLFEPKWDGFRCIVFRDGDEVELGSRNEKPLTRYFPELIEPLLASLPDRCVVDGEVVVASEDGLDFDALQQRIHPAESRVNRLAAETPARFVAFDLLALDDRSLLEVPFHERRAELERVLGAVEAPVHLTPSTADRSVAQDWFVRFEGAGLDGVIAKPAEGAYVPDKRVQFKIKHQRTADCVVAGYRTHKDGEGVGSLLLGLYDEEGRLHHMGVASSFSAARRKELRRRGRALPGRRPLASIRGASGRPPRRTRPTATDACPAGSHVGTPRRTCRSRRCARSGWPRSPTSGSTPAASGTAPACSVGVPTATRTAARSTSSRWSRPTSCWRCSAPEPAQAGTTRRILSPGFPLEVVR